MKREELMAIANSIGDDLKRDYMLRVKRHSFSKPIEPFHKGSYIQGVELAYRQLTKKT